jgi:hypothetical protein
MSKKIDKYQDFVKTNEELDLSLDSFKGLMNKVKTLISTEKIKEFIKNNKEEVEKLKNSLTNEEGDLDYSKAFSFAKNEVKK